MVHIEHGLHLSKLMCGYVDVHVVGNREVQAAVYGVWRSVHLHRIDGVGGGVERDGEP